MKKEKWFATPFWGYVVVIAVFGLFTKFKFNRFTLFQKY